MVGTWVTVVMSIAHGLRLEMSFSCGSMWLTKYVAHAIHIVQAPSSIFIMFSDRNSNENFHLPLTSESVPYALQGGPAETHLVFS